MNYFEKKKARRKVKQQEKEVRRIERAMKLLPQVTVSNDILLLAAKISITLGVDGHARSRWHSHHVPDRGIS